jgi:hypothetical protein
VQVGETGGRFLRYVRRDREIQGCMERLVVIHTRANSVEKKNLSHHQSVSDRWAEIETKGSSVF